MHLRPFAHLMVATCLVGFMACARSAPPASSAQNTFGAVNPRPGVVVEPGPSKVALDLGTVSDMQVPGEGLLVKEFRTTLTNGFRTMVGNSYVPQTVGANVILRIHQAQLSRGNLGNLGAFITIRYSAEWLLPDGTAVAQLNGVAQPRNPTETGPRHLEDVVEVMYEEMVQGLEKVQGIKTRPADTASK